jgi:hypothetical protein
MCFGVVPMPLLHYMRRSISSSRTIAAGLEPEGNARGEFRVHASAGKQAKTLRERVERGSHDRRRTPL